MAAIAADPALRLRDLAQDYGVSGETIRRDLQELDEAGAIRRTYGGAVRNQAPEGLLEARLTRNIAERQAICHAALAHVAGVFHMFLGGGSTCIFFARALANHQSSTIVVVTQSYIVAQELAKNPNIRVMLLPGVFDAGEAIVHGPDTIAAIAGYHVDLAVLTATGLSRAGISEGLVDYAHSHGAMIAAAEKVLILAEGEKFDREGFLRIAGWSPKMSVISGHAPSPGLAKHLNDQGVELTLAGDERGPK